MAHLRGEHVDRAVLHVRRLYSALDRVLPGRLENDLHRHFRSPGSGDRGAVAGAGEREVARQSKSRGEGDRDPG